MGRNERLKGKRKKKERNVKIKKENGLQAVSYNDNSVLKNRKKEIEEKSKQRTTMFLKPINYYLHIFAY